jgi:hypothetical protein
MTHRKPVILQQQDEYFNNPSLVHPWFDEMIGRANEVLNALLRLKKYQLASEHPLHIQKNHQGTRPGKQVTCNLILVFFIIIRKKKKKNRKKGKKKFALIFFFFIMTHFYSKNIGHLSLLSLTMSYSKTT